MSAFHAQRLRNRLLSAAILFGLVGVLALVGFVLGGTAGALIALVAAAAFVAFAPRMRSQWILRRGGARPLPLHEAPEVHRIVRELAAEAELSTPALMLLPTPIPNALATGEGRDRTLAVSVGLLRHLTMPEVRAVLAHEMMHLKHGDTFMLRLVATLDALTGSMSRIGVWLAILQLPLVLMGGPAVPWVAIVVLVLAPTLSAALRLALSRTRELDADLGAVRLTGDPSALASALRKLEALERRTFQWLPVRLQVPSWLRTHPATEERVRRLQELKGRSTPAAPDTPPPPRPRTPPPPPTWSKPKRDHWTRDRPPRPSAVPPPPPRHAVRRRPRRGAIVVIDRPAGYSEL